MRLRFGELTFDPGRREVYRGPEPLRLSPKAFQLLALLVGRRPDAVGKQDLLDALWPDAVVTEGSLAALVKDLRRALGETAQEPSVVRTVFGFGYAFDAPVVEVSDVTSRHRHVLLWGRQETALGEGANVVGRVPEAAVWVAHRSVSREHARVVVRGETAEIEDLASKNGTFRGSQRVTGRVALSNGDEVRLGEVRLLYFGPGADPGQETVTAE